MNRFSLAAATALLLIVATTATAQESQNAFRRFEINWNIVSYSRMSAADWGGSQLAFAAKVHPHLAVVAEFDGQSDTCDCQTLTAQRFGVRYSAPLGKRWTHFEEVLAGPAQSDTLYEGNGFSLLAGAGVDFAIRPWFALRPAEVGYSYYHFGSNTNLNGVRYGGGLVFRFGH